MRKKKFVKLPNRISPLANWTFYCGKGLALTKKIVAENHITCLMITHNIPSALSLGNRTIMMNNGRIVLELAGAERENMTTEQLLKVFHEQGVSNDRILFSAES